MTTPKDAATPRPWEEIDGMVFGADGFEIADPTQGPHLSKTYNPLRRGAHWATTPNSYVERTEEEEKANAALIIHAVNSHDALVKALQKILVARDDEEVVTIASDALALAGVES